MTLLELKKQALTLDHPMTFVLPNGETVPAHFHLTEIGKISKHFIDCGGVLRREKRANLQLWSANDFDHRLQPEKLVTIIVMAEKTLHLGDLDVEVTYQGVSTIETYGLEVTKNGFQLLSLTTNCLAADACGISPEQLPQRESQKAKCDPASNCC